MMKEATLRRAAGIGGLLLAASLLGQQMLRRIQPPWGDQINNYPFELENFVASCCDTFLTMVRGESVKLQGTFPTPWATGRDAAAKQGAEEGSS